MEWILIKEKYPESGKPVLVTDGKRIVVAELTYGTMVEPENAYWDTAFITGYDREFTFDEKQITHWAELPVLPNGKPIKWGG